ncbi:MAG: DUF1186 family protein [Candidatus Margulisbacteria bacterium]|nr:DUF1186 family protein [Candidatus Margulisiibacteriota bacterium]MBU1616464.1 DUF1186 family protein [Candidatus Margulisiibacteriota bacterium]
MIEIPGQKPFTPPITPKEAKAVDKEATEQTAQKPASMPKGPIPQGIGRGPELDAQAIATRLAVLATEAKEKELKFEDIIDRAIAETGMTNAQGAMEEVNRRIQQEIEAEIDKIKDNKDLMEEAESWQEFAETLSRMNKEQVESFMGLLQETIKAKSF